MGQMSTVPGFSMLSALGISLVVIFLAIGRSQVEKQWLVVLRFSLALLLRLRLVVEQQVGRVVPPAVGHHHRAYGARVDVLDLEEALDDVDVLRLDVLKTQKANCIP